jgi:flagellar biosynthetic protein FliR
MPDTLTSILPHIPAFLLVLFRLSGIFLFAPLFSSAVVPMQLRALLTLVLAFCVYPLVPPQLPIELSMATMVPAIATELAIGAIIGYGASLPLAAMQLGGNMMGLQLGMGLATIYNPDFNEETEVISQLFYMVALTVFILLDGHHALLSSLIHTFKNIPLGGYRPGTQALSLIVGLLAAMIELGVRVAAPLLCLVFLETVAMGFVAKTMPQLNVMTLGFPLRIMLGIGMIIVIAAAMNEAFIASVRQTLSAMSQLMGA